VRYQPQLATLVEEPPRGGDWLHEIKYDGYRIGCHLGKRRAQLESRNGKDWTGTFPEVVEAARALAIQSALLDGEVVVVLPDGRTSFQALQNALTGRRGARLAYYVFDLLELDGRDLSRRPLEERKEALRRIVPGAGASDLLRFSDHVTGGGERFFRAACQRGLEGIVSKRRGQPHHAGRSKWWLKTKCTARQELVIGGFTEPEGTRAGIGALLVGVYEGRQLRYAGKVGTGFTQAIARDLRGRLDAIETDQCPFAGRPPARLGRQIHWVRPVLVAEVEFTEWTQEGKIRHPSFQGLRRDKDPRQVRRETPP
jgi:bifunctional non-homologous end joining protein LigD